MKHKLLKKVMSVALSVLMLTGAGLVLPAVIDSGTVTVSAVEVYEDFMYVVNDDNTVTIYKYSGGGGDITIPASIDGKSVSSIGDYAFYDCDSLTSVTIGNSVTSIGYYGFYYCTGLTSVTIGNGVTSIGASAFYGCTSLTSVTIPDSVTSIGDNAFRGCTGLTDFTVGVANTVYSSIDGVVLTKDKKQILVYPCGKKGAYTIPFGVTSIGDYAFSGCTGLTGVAIPDSVTSIDNYAFYRCVGLTSVTIPDSVTVISESAFRGCTNLSSVIIPDGVTSIGKDVFYRCRKLTIYGKEGSYAETYANENDIKFAKLETTQPLKNTSEISAATISFGKSVTTTCSATGGNAPYQFAVHYKQDSQTSWTCAQSYSTNTTVSITPKAATTYTVRVKAKDANGKVLNKDFKVTVNKTTELKNNTRISAVSANLGDSVKITGSATGGTSPYQYVFYYKKSTDSSYKQLKALNTTATATFKPTQAGTYNIRTKVKDSAGKVVVKDLTLDVVNELKNTTKVSVSSISLGRSVKITGSATGGTSPYQYVFYYKKSTDSSYKQLKALNTTATATFKPTQSGTYNIRTKVKDSAGKVVVKDFTVKVV